MSGKIRGDAKAIALLEKAVPGDKKLLTSIEMLNQLPDEFEAVVDFVRFDPAKDFGGENDVLMPEKQLYSDMAEKRGIEGDVKYIMESIYEEVDYNRLLCKSIELEPMMKKMHVGYRCTKWGYVMTEDGTRQRSTACIVDYNAWTRCCEEWSGEESKTNGYDPNLRKGTPGNYLWEIFWYDKETKKQKSYFLYPKYDTAYKRRNHLDRILKWAQRNTDTKAWHTVIRSMSGMQTGYTAADIKDGYFVTAKIIRSSAAVKLDAMARRQAMIQGIAPKELSQSEEPFEEPVSTMQDITPPEPPAAPEPETLGSFETPPEQELDPRTLMPVERLVYVFEKYIETSWVPAGISPDGKTTWMNLILGMVQWLKDTPCANTLPAKKPSWEKAISNLRVLENLIPELARVQHGLY